MLRVIIADDHPIVRIGQRVVIEAGGRCKVVGEADGPDELLKLLSSVACDVLVTDFAMPGGQQADGYGLLGLLRRQYPTLPVILVTMFANVATLRASFAHGARAIVAKSASARELPTAIATVTRGEPFVSECLRAQLAEAGTGDQLQQPQLSSKEREVVRMAGQRHDRQPDCGPGQSQYFHDQQAEKHGHEPAVHFHRRGSVCLCPQLRHGAVALVGHSRCKWR